METAFYLVSASLAGLFCFSLSFSYMHMFQLEGYRAKGYLKWLMQYGFGSVLAVIGMAILYALAYMLRAVLGEIAGWVLLAGFAGLGVLFLCKFRVKDAKKPLVYTSRVKRMLCCEGILILLPCRRSNSGAFRGPSTALSHRRKHHQRAHRGAGSPALFKRCQAQTAGAPGAH